MPKKVANFTSLSGGLYNFFSGFSLHSLLVLEFVCGCSSSPPFPYLTKKGFIWTYFHLSHCWLGTFTDVGKQGHDLNHVLLAKILLFDFVDPRSTTNA